MKGKLEQPELGISTKEYLQLVLNNRRITRGSVNAVTTPIIPFQSPPTLARNQSFNSNKEKKNLSKDLDQVASKNKSSKHNEEDHEISEAPGSQRTRDAAPLSGQVTAKPVKPVQHLKPPKPYKYQEVLLEIPKPIKLFSFEQAIPPLRNEFPLGLNLLRHRHLKIIQKDVSEDSDKITFYNAFIAKRNKNDYSQIAIEFFDEKLNSKSGFNTSLGLEDSKDRSFILNQDIGIIELDQNKFDQMFATIDPNELSFDMMKTKNDIVYWPVVVLNNCAVDTRTREFLTAEIEDDCDFLKEFISNHSENDTGIKMEDNQDRILIKKETLDMFGEEQESDDVQILGKEDFLRVQEDLKDIFDDDDEEEDDGGSGEDEDDDVEPMDEENEESKENKVQQRIQKKKSNRKSKKREDHDNENPFASEEHEDSLLSLEQELLKENVESDPKLHHTPEEKGRKHVELLEHNITKEDIQGQEHEDVSDAALFRDLPVKKKVKTEEDQIVLKKEKLEDYHYTQMIFKELEEDGVTVIWRRIHEVKLINNENKGHLVSLAKKSKFLNKMVAHFAKLIKDYNSSTQDSDYSLPISNKIMKDNLFRIIHLGTEDRVLRPMIPLVIKEKKNENFTILRVLDDYSLFIVKNNDSKTVVKISSFLPPLEISLIEGLDNLAILKHYNKENFIKQVLFPMIYPRNLIDVNYFTLKAAHKRVILNKQASMPEDSSNSRHIRCKQCNYILGNLSYHKCIKCEESFHDHCISEKKVQPNSSKAIAKPEKKQPVNWVCRNCKNCSYCASRNNRDQLAFCNNCDEAYHTFCIQSLHHNYHIEGGPKGFKFICTECALCQMCGCEINNFSDKNITEEGLTLCNECIDVRLRKEYCPICNKRWDGNSNTPNKEDNEMIECQCRMWIHRECDPELTKELFKEFSLTGRVYHCTNCRRAHKNKQLIELINILIDLDESKYFILPVDENAAPNYRQVISCPMDFDTMTKKALNSQYIDDPYNMLKADFDLICNNAMIYNMPKSQFFLAAKKLKKFGHKAFLFFRELVECSDREFLKFSRKLTPNHYLSQFKREIEEYYIDILFEENEMNPLTRIRVVDYNKTNPFNANANGNPAAVNAKKNQNKEVYIEITGLNHLLNEKITREERRTMETRSRHEQGERKSNLYNNDDSESVNLDTDQKNLELISPFDDEVKTQNAWGKLTMKEGTALIEELLSLTTKNKPFFYFSPVVIQFTNPNLIKQDICYLCASFGEVPDFLFCSICQEGYHYYCISKSYNETEKFSHLKANKAWQCPKCKLCQKCHKKSETHDCLICETCDNLYHLNCIYPQVGVLFPSEWRCEECFKCSRCGSNKLFSDNLNVESGNIQPEFCEDFKWCYECGLKMAYFKFCKICKKFCQKSVSSSKNDTRSLQYINPAEDSVECKMCKFKYHISCYEEEYFPVNDYDNFACYNCKIDDEELTKVENDMEEKAERIIVKRRQIKHLMRICEAIFNLHLNTQSLKNDFYKENTSKLIFEYVIEDYEFLTKEKHVKSMLENYKLLNTATKLLGIKYIAPNFAVNATPHKNEDLVLQERIPELEYIDPFVLSEKCDLFDFIEKIPITYSTDLELFHELTCTLSLKDDQMEALPTETSREYYDYNGFIKIKDEESSFWILLPQEVIYEENPILESYSLMPSLSLLSGICLRQESKTPIFRESQYRQELLSYKTSQLLTFTELLIANDNYHFESITADENDNHFVQEKLSNVVDNIAEMVWIPYWKTVEDIRFSLFNKSLETRTNRNALLVSLSAFDQDEFVELFCKEGAQLPVKTININVSTEDIHKMDEELVIAENNIEHKEERKYYAELKDVFINEMTATQVIKRRLKAWFELKKEVNTSSRGKHLGSARHVSRLADRHHHNGVHHNTDTHNSITHTEIPNSLVQTPTNASRMALEETESVNKIPKDVQLSDETAIAEQDSIGISPMESIECICCKIPGDRKLSGRLLFVDCDQWVHTNCALWSYDVFENIEGGLVNFIIAYRRSLATVCSYCQKSGATIFCFSKKCQNKYHFRCAFLAKSSFLTCKKFYCKHCSVTKSLGNKVNTDFSTHRRLYIVRNQNLFYMESSRNSRFIKEKPLEMQSGAFNRIGNLTIISARKYNSDVRFLVSEYSVTKILSQNNERKAIFATLSLQDSIYNYKFSRIDDSVLINKKSLYAQKLSHDSEETWRTLETADGFFENLASFLHDTPIYLSPKEKISKKELLGEFFAFYSFDVRRWLKSSVIIDEEEDGVEKKEYPSFKEYYYSQDIDEVNPFSRQDKVEEIYNKIVPKIQNLIQSFNSKDELERFRNPKERSFNRMSKRIKSNKRKTELLGHFGFVAEEIPVEPHFGLPGDHAKYAKIQSTELENKLLNEYWTHKRKPVKVLVAPSPIHRYGLFALENFNKNEIVIEYCGEVIRNKIADLREANYKKEGFGDCFMFRADKDAVIDASFKGNQARYLNHSCNPSCSSIILEVEDQPKIIMYANRPIYAGEELTYDYQFDVEAEKIECTCGAKNCQGRLN